MCEVCVFSKQVSAVTLLLRTEGAELIEHGSTTEPGFRAPDMYDCRCSIAGLNCCTRAKGGICQSPPNGRSHHTGSDCDKALKER